MSQDDVSDYLKKSLNYLSNLSSRPNITKLDFHYFDILLKLEYQPDWDELLLQNATVIIDLLKKQRNVLCTELARAFWIIASHRWPNIIENFIDSSIDKSYHWLYPLLKNLSVEDELILYSGMLAYVTNYEYNFSADSFYYKIDDKLGQEISQLLSNVRFIDVTLSLADQWLAVLLGRNIARSDEAIIDILTSLLAVIVAFWNHRLVYRCRIDSLVMKYLEFDHSVSKSNDEECIDDMTMYKYMGDISWKVPFKYFICRYLLKFAVSMNALSEVLNMIKEELSEGFAKSLHNKNVVGVEMELFTFCLNHFPYEEWKSIFYPLTNGALRKTSLASYFAKWWLPQIVKKFPAFVNLLYRDLENSNGEILSIVRIPLLKICHREKIPLTVAGNEQSLIFFLTSQFAVVEKMRGEVFSLLCDLHDQSVLHSELELRTILTFLKYNVNSNCTMLRQMMLSSFSRFIQRLICSCVRIIKKSEHEADNRLNPVLAFLENFNDFITDGMQPGCSYQRKVTSLNLYKILMSYAIRECGSTTHRNYLKDGYKLADFAKKRNAWPFESDVNRKLLFNCLMDLCEEIQNLASMLLRSYFKLGNDLEIGVFQDAMRLLKHKLFYRRNSGVFAVNSLISMAYSSFDEPNRVLRIEHSTFLDYFLSLLESKVVIMDRDILDAAVNHPLDADIKVLSFLIADQSSPEVNQVTEEQVERVIGQLEIIVPILLKALFVDKSSDYAPSFEESDLALRLLIKNSILRDTIPLTDDEDECQLQPLSQLLLNFIWIALKACGELETALIMNRTSLMNEKQIIRCCDLIVNKLKFCRHKGVIEAAGVALSNVVKTLTAQNLCEGWLESVVMEILQLIEFKSGATISRKSAGLSLLIQNVVASDKRPNKPLIDKCWTEFKRILAVDYDSLNMDVSQETPQTHALHLLRVIVADARNNTELLPYLEEITTLCLTTLKAPVWLIRNAALQLFGVLLPKIVGQRNATPEVGVRCTFEEIFLTKPRILDHMMLTLEQATQQGGSVQHADLAPILAILMNIRLISTIMLDNTLYEKLLKLRVLVEGLLGSDLYTIRELASKAFLALYSPDDILQREDLIVYKVIKYITRGEELDGENHVHGCLLALKQIYDFYPQPRTIWKCITLEQSLNVSMVSQALLFDMQMVDMAMRLEDFFSHIVGILDIVLNKRYLSVGYDQWLRVILNTMLENFEYAKVINGCLKCSHSVVLVACLDTLCGRQVDESVFLALLDCLENYLLQDQIDMTNRIVQTFVELYKPENKISCDKFIKKYFDVFFTLDVYHFQGANVHMLGILTANSNHRINDVLRIILETLDITRFNKTIRLSSARSMLNLSQFVNKKNADMKVIWKIFVDLVQDEEADIRFIGSACFGNVFHMELDYGPEFTMNSLFNPCIVENHLDRREFIDVLWDKVKVSSFPTHSDQIRNPFDQGIVNCYEEEIKIVQLAGEALIIILQRDLDLCKEYFCNYKFEENFEAELKSSLNEYLVSTEEYLWCLKCFYSCLIGKCIDCNKEFDKSIQMLEQVLKIS